MRETENITREREGGSGRRSPWEERGEEIQWRERERERKSGLLGVSRMFGRHRQNRSTI